MDYDNTQPPPIPQYQYGTPPPPKQETSSSGEERGGRGLASKFFQSCLVAGCATVLAPLILIGGFVLIAGYGIFSGMGEGAAFLPFGEMAGGDTLMTRTVRPGAEGAGTIALVTVQGTIEGSGSTLEGEGMMAFVAEQLRRAEEDEDVKAVILQIDSPGGGLSASDQLYNRVLALRKTGKPVIAWAGGLMASGGYYIAAGADQIMASPAATVGSIGVVLQHVQVAELLDSLGIAVDPVVSGKHKDIGSPFREMTEEERALLQEYIDIAHGRFVDIVAKGRDMPRDEVAALADGSIMGAEAALEKGLVDSVGYIEDAVALVEAELGESDMRLVAYRRVFSFEDVFSAAGAKAAGAAGEAAVRALRGAAATVR